MLASALALLFPVAIAGAVGDVPTLQGKWKVVAVFEDGQSISEKEIATRLFADGTITIDGPVISFLAVGARGPDLGRPISRMTAVDLKGDGRMALLLGRGDGKLYTL